MIGFVTYEKHPDLTEDDRPLADALARAGHQSRAVRWDDHGEHWEEYDALVLRSCWDYHLRPAEFARWLDTIDRARVPLWNPSAVVRWNMHKSYLRDLESHGIAVPRTVWLRARERRTLAGIMKREGWKEAVVKPAVSASATHTWRATAATAADVPFADLVKSSDVLVQELIPEVARDGEWSIVLIDGQFSHAAIKRPKAGDFRVQWEHGGSAEPATAPPHVVDAALAAARHIPGDWLYARVDGVVTARGFVLMELECIEPHLFLSYRPEAVERFVSALVRRTYT